MPGDRDPDIGHRGKPVWRGSGRERPAKRNAVPRGPDGASNDSHNHHFFGDIARWFVREVAGLRVEDRKTVTIRPAFLNEVNFAEAYYDLPAGRVAVWWIRDESLRYDCPETVTSKIETDKTVVINRCEL